MADTTANDPGCGCCRPDPKSADDIVRELLARREVLDRRLRRLEPAGLRGPNAAGLRGPNAVPGLRGPNAVPGLRGPNAVIVGAP